MPRAKTFQKKVQPSTITKNSQLKGDSKFQQEEETGENVPNNQSRFQKGGRGRSRGKNLNHSQSRDDADMPDKKSVKKLQDVSLTAKLAFEVKQKFNEITEQILSGGLEPTAVTNVQVRSLIILFRQHAYTFQQIFFAWIDQLLVAQAEDAFTRNLYRLIEQFIFALLRNEETNKMGTILVKQLLKHILDIYSSPKLLNNKLQFNCGYLLTQLISVSSTKELKPVETHSEALNVNGESGTKAIGTSSTSVFTFTLLNTEKREDRDLKLELEATIVRMLSTTSATNMQRQGITLSKFVSDCSGDQIFTQMAKLLLTSKSADIRKRIVKAFKAPYSPAALALLGKRLRDTSPEIVELIFSQLRVNKVTIGEFPSAEARMLVLTEGFSSKDENVRQACLDFLKPTVTKCLEQDDLAFLFKLIDAKRAFQHQYYSRMPGMMVLAILKILDDDEIKLVDYLENVVIRKLRKMAGLKGEKKHKKKTKVKKEHIGLYDDDEESEYSEDEVDDDGKIRPQGKYDKVMRDEGGIDALIDTKPKSLQKEDFSDPVTFEEILLLRLTYEINRGTQRLRHPDYTDKLELIQPDFSEYRQILLAISKMPEPNLPQIDPKLEQFDPYPRGQRGFSRRAVLGEWVKYSLQMNISDEVIRRNLCSLCFELIGRIEFSYEDYEHLLRKRIQLIGDGTGNISTELALNKVCQSLDEEIPAEVEEMLMKRVQDFQGYDDEQPEDDVEIILREFKSLGTERTLQEYCKPYSLETLTLDYDDVCQVAVTVAKTLIGDRVEEFQIQMLETISTIKELAESNPEQQKHDQFGGEINKVDMMFSQIPMHQQMEEQAEGVGFQQMRDKFMKKIMSLSDKLQEQQSEFEEDEFGRLFHKLQIYIHMFEEAHLKQKLAYKRSLILCRSLLKQCRITNIEDENVINIAETLIHPAVMDPQDQENIVLALECIGLLTILNKDVFLNYAKIFHQLLIEDTKNDNKIQKVIAIKSVVDGLIIHGLTDERTSSLFDLIVHKYITIRDRILRQVTIEGVSKMLFTKKLCEENNQELVEATLAQLLIQFFDKKYNFQNSLVKSILSQFFRNFVLFSEQRCFMLLNAVTKIIYSILRAKYGVDLAKGKKKIISMPYDVKKQGKGKKKNDFSDSEFEEDEDAYLSDDSDFVQKKASMKQILENIDSTQLLTVCLVLLRRSFVNEMSIEHSGIELKLKQELTVVFLQRLALMNCRIFKKTAIVKDIIQPILDSIRFEGCDDLDLLKSLAENSWLANSKMLVQSGPKIVKFEERLNLRIQELEEIQEVQGNPSNLRESDIHQTNLEDQQDVEMSGSNSKKQEKDLDTYNSELLSNYWDTFIEERDIDRVDDDDRELLEIQKVWFDLSTGEMLGMSARKKMHTPGKTMNKDLFGRFSSSKKSVKSTSGIKPRRGRRNKTQNLAQTAGVFGNRLHSIVEEPLVNISGSERPNQKRVRIIEQDNGKKRPDFSKMKSDISEEEDDEEDYESEDDEMEEESYEDDEIESSELSQAGKKMTFVKASKNLAKNFATKSRLSSSSNDDKFIENNKQSKNILKIGVSPRPYTDIKSASSQKSQSPQPPLKTKASKKLNFREEILNNKVNNQGNTSLVSENQKKKASNAQKRVKRGSSNISQREASLEDDEDSSESIYDFMDGKMTREMKKRQAAKKNQAASTTTPQNLSGGKPMTTRRRRNILN